MSFKNLLSGCCILAFAGFFSSIVADVSQDRIKATNAVIDTLRKRDCSIRISTSKGQPIDSATVTVKQIRHHFGFGAAIPFRILKDTMLQKVFLDHFEWAVFENELKWPSTDPTPNGPNYSQADSMLDFCKAHDIKVRGHCLFWNQKKDWIPTWTWTLNTTDFKTAVNKRIDSALTHYKGKLEQWDAANEVIHSDSMLFETKSGDKNIWSYIFDRAHKTDSTVKFVINDFNIIERWSVTDSFIRKINSIRNPATGVKGPIDLIGLEGHFDKWVEIDDYKSKLDMMATVGLPLWITEMDFSIPMDVRCDRLEEMLRIAYANPKMEGFVFWVFWQGNRWRNDISSYIADSATYKINDFGLRYEKLLKEWTTTASGKTTTSGDYAFKGFHGRYEVTTKVSNLTQIDTIYLEPGKGIKNCSITFKTGETGKLVKHTDSQTAYSIHVNGRTIKCSLLTRKSEPLLASVYSTSGRLITRQLIKENGTELIPNNQTGCFLIQITTGKKVLYSAKGLNTGSVSITK